MTRANEFRWLLGLVIIGAIVAIASGCGKQSTEAKVERRDIVAYAQVEGKVVAPAAARANLYPPYRGRIGRIYATVGQRVRQGDAVMDLAEPQTQTYYDQSRAALLQAQKALIQARTDYEQGVSVARKQLATAYAAQKQAASAGSAQGGAGPSTSPTPTATITPDIPTAQQAVIDAKARMAEGLAPYQQAVVTAQEQFQQAQAGQKAAQVKSPITGTVLAVNISPGATADPNSKKPLATIVNLDALQVRARLGQDELAKVRIGNTAVLAFEEVPNEKFLGSLEQTYSCEAGFLQGPDYCAVVDFHNRRGLAKPGMSGAVAIQTGRARDVLAVPADAVYRAGDREAVKVRVGGKWRTRVVETGLTNGRFTRIRSGLAEGDIVQVSP